MLSVAVSVIHYMMISFLGSVRIVLMPASVLLVHARVYVKLALMDIILRIIMF